MKKYKFIISKALSADPKQRFLNVDQMRQAFVSAEPWEIVESLESESFSTKITKFKREVLPKVFAASLMVLVIMSVYKLFVGNP